MRVFYSLLMYLLAPFILMRLWWKGRKLPAYRQRISERFYLDKKEDRTFDIWLHAVSLGEVIAAIPLIDALLDKNWSVLVTTMTPTGSERVLKHFGQKVSHRYIPYDLPCVLKRFFTQIKPRVGVIMETELWPNLIYQAAASQVPLLLANARLSERSLKGYLWFKFFFEPLLNQFSAVLAQSEDDAQRLMALGVQKNKILVSGNLKFDLYLHTDDSKKYKELQTRWGACRIAVIAASTHEGEESQIIEHLKILQQAIPQVILLIAPRHPERFESVYQLCVQSGFNTGLRSNLDTLSKHNDIVVLDSLGELRDLFKISDYAFIGGSLVPVGGHNVLEPIAMKKPVISGNHVHNFKTICRDLQEAQAIQLVNSGSEVIKAIITLHQNERLKLSMIENATKVLENNKGALKLHVDKIESLISSR